MASPRGKLHRSNWGLVLIGMALVSLVIGFLTAFTVVGPLGFGLLATGLLIAGIFFFLR